MGQVFFFLAGLFGIVLALLGVVVTLKPTPPEQAVAWLVAFAGIALAALACMFAQAIITHRDEQGAAVESEALRENLTALRREFQAFVAVAGQPKTIVRATAGAVAASHGDATPTVADSDPPVLRAHKLAMALLEWLPSKALNAPDVSSGSDFEESAERFVDYMRATRVDYGATFEPRIRGLLADLESARVDARRLRELYERPTLGFQDYETIMDELSSIAQVDTHDLDDLRRGLRAQRLVCRQPTGHEAGAIEVWE